jgi:WhiB family redox-sensing transcriptional regulator
MSSSEGDWRHRAACRDEDPELFFPMGTGGRESQTSVGDKQVAAAKSVCLRCPVRRACLDWALVALAEGIAGGLTEDERRALKNQAPRRPGRRRGEAA